MGLFDWISGGNEKHTNPVNEVRLHRINLERIKFISEVTNQHPETVKVVFPTVEDVDREFNSLYDVYRYAQNHVVNNWGKLSTKINTGEIGSNIKYLSVFGKDCKVEIVTGKSPPSLQKCEVYSVYDGDYEFKFNLKIVVGRYWDSKVFDLTV